MVQSTKEVLEERGTRYGIFMNQARIAQSIHIILDQAMELTGKNRFSFAPDQLEAVNMIVNKLARIYNGDPHYSDSWRDIAGYATLVADRLDNDMEKQKLIEEQMRDEQNTTGRDVEADRSCDEGCQCERKAEGTEPGSDNRPTGQSELRRMPVRLEVQDGNHTAPTTEASAGVPTEPRQ